MVGLASLPVWHRLRITSDAQHVQYSLEITLKNIGDGFFFA